MTGDIATYFNYKRRMPKVSAISESIPDVYLDLVNSIKQEITKTRDELQKQKAICYWKIGRHIARHLLNNKGRSGYNERLYPRLSHDLKIECGRSNRPYHFTEHSQLRARGRN